MSFLLRKHFVFAFYCAAHFTGTFLEGGVWVQWSGCVLTLCVYSKLSGPAVAASDQRHIGNGWPRTQEDSPRNKKA